MTSESVHRDQVIEAQVRRRFRYQECGCQRCSYCERWLATRHEHDHFPIPGFHHRKEAEVGQDVRPTCIDCHDLKDRIGLGDWPKEMLAQAHAQLEESLGYDAVLLLGFLHSWTEGRWAEEELDPDWRQRQADFYAATTDRLPYPARLYMAKSVALAFHASEDRRVKLVQLV